MKIAGRVVDAINKEPLPSASIAVTNSFYEPVGPGTVADESGNFSLDSSELNNPYNMVLVSFVGYREAVLSPTQANGEIALNASDASLQSVIVTAKKRVQQIKSNNTWYYAAIAATVVMWAGFTYYQVK